MHPVHATSQWMRQQRLVKCSKAKRLAVAVATIGDVK